MTSSPTDRIDRRALLRLGAAATGALALPASLHAQSAWPSKAIRFVVPFAPGGSSEIIARATAAEMQKILGQSVFVDNRPGGAGNVAMGEVARADDQHTIILGHIGTMAVNPFIFDRLPYDLARDFRPVSLLAKVPSLYLVHPDLPVRSMSEFIAHAKKNPGRLNYGSAGNGSAGHLAMEYLKMASGTFITHVPYRGTGPMLTDLIAGRLDAASIGAAAVLQFIRAGKLRCIATGTTQRIAQLPDVPTVAEQGFPGFEMTQWYGLNVPANLPQPAIERLATAAARAVREPATLERLAHDAAIAVGSTSADYAKFIEAEQKRWKPVIARAKIKPD
ncbi:MAG: tripartite tricarboxylate transporter substrate binding protein [Sphaerotilus natans subsp. sulfidivorans]|uniref:Bug family tripartite tricarboxylate transporter substrate binding protein n=1 Tax=Sphaerotilus sulfidivorans TaxID=639200 RepID=UPI002356DA29|nr:tripartite tricarboxylate transporter substrate binding protein [Sphaerotilus sulfidivorans]MCK6403728.1 tripartite tricarboxylate transporter substrate binding protein [Sphaerotilus sulfidivorans]